MAGIALALQPLEDIVRALQQIARTVQAMTISDPIDGFARSMQRQPYHLQDMLLLDVLAMEPACLVHKNTRKDTEPTMQMMITDNTLNDLGKGIQKLPQELQDEILLYTIAFEPTAVLINNDTRKYTPPWQLSINKVSRRFIAKIFYTHSTFLIDVGPERMAGPLLTGWLSSLAPEHRNMLRCVRYRLSNRVFAWDERINGLYQARLDSVRVIMMLKRLLLRKGALQGWYLERRGGKLKEKVIRL